MFYFAQHIDFFSLGLHFNGLFIHLSNCANSMFHSESNPIELLAPEGAPRLQGPPLQIQQQHFLRFSIIPHIFVISFTCAGFWDAKLYC